MKTLGVAALGLALSAGAALSKDVCGPREVIIGKLTEGYGEKPSGAGLEGDERMFEVFASDAHGTWSIVVTGTDGLSCIVAVGRDWMPSPDKKGEPA